MTQIKLSSDDKRKKKTKKTKTTEKSDVREKHVASIRMLESVHFELKIRTTTTLI